MSANNSKILVIVALSAIGFAVAISVVVITMCESCFETQKSIPVLMETPEQICSYDSRCINASKPIYNTTIATDVGKSKIQYLQNLTKKPIIQNALLKSNEKHALMDPDIRDQIFFQREKTWTSADTPTPFMVSIIENDVADFLRENHVIHVEENNDIVYGEHILTDRFGPNVAVSVKTDNYLQKNDDWWIRARNIPNDLPFARECEFDSSAQMYSEDLVVGIYDKSGQLIGIMNSATPCDVTQEAADAEVIILPVDPKDYTAIGVYKIEYLKNMTSHPVIQKALAESNLEFSGFTDIDLSLLKNQTETPSNWPKPGTGEPTALQLSILQNEAAELLRQNLNVTSEEFGQILFPEMIITNAKGVNVASSHRTYNYVQSQDDWWLAVKEHGEIVRYCGFDRSIKMNSEDILLKIYNENGTFVGILNSASECNVIDDKPGAFFGDSN